MQIETPRFGTIEYQAEDVLTFPEGILGFEECKRYIVLRHRDDSPFLWLQSLDVPQVAFLVTDPAAIVPDYAPEMPAPVARMLELDENTPRLVYVILSIPPGKPHEMTANLAGPLLINVEKRTACQVVVEDEQWTTKHRVFPEPAREQEAADAA
jgi:flagellar assembly factor FliW